jgi:hypothetical protein
MILEKVLCAWSADWLDAVRHEVEVSRGPLTKSPFSTVSTKACRRRRTALHLSLRRCNAGGTKCVPGGRRHQALTPMGAWTKGLSPKIAREPRATGACCIDQDQMWGFCLKRADEWSNVGLPGADRAAGDDLG